AALSPVLVVAAVALVAVLYVRGGRRRVAASAAAVAGFVAFSKVLSPQYLTWLVPLAAAVLATALVLTHLEWERFLQPHGGIDHWGDALAWWVLARDLVLVGLFALLALRL